jgi:hypothetical protein
MNALLPPSKSLFARQRIEPAVLRSTAVRSDIPRLRPVSPRPAAGTVSFRVADE